jgi:uncharacterized OsmC-like protein
MHNVNVEALDQTVQLEIDADAKPEKLEELKRLADEHCPGVFCLRNPVELHTSVHVSSSAG